jgi:hypothetical protein
MHGGLVWNEMALDDLKVLACTHPRYEMLGQKQREAVRPQHQKAASLLTDAALMCCDCLDSARTLSIWFDRQFLTLTRI